jgi:hypothetical protein
MIIMFLKLKSDEFVKSEKERNISQLFSCVCFNEIVKLFLKI